MIEFLIKAEPKEFLHILKESIYPILKKDPMWHFWNEGKDGLIVRCSKSFKGKVYKELTKSKYDCYIQDWNHDQKIVEEHWDYMTKIFHINSEYAMELTINTQYHLHEDDIWLFEDRICHSFFNNVEMTAMDKSFLRESAELASILIARARYDGILIRAREEKEVQNGNSSGEGDKS